MKYWKNIIWLLLFLSLHLSDRFFLASHWIFYAALFIGSLSLISKKKMGFTLGIGTSGALILLGSFILRFFIQGNLYGTYTIYMLLAYWLLFFIWIIQFNQDKSGIKIIAGIVILTGVIEIVWGFGQLLGFINNNNDYFRLGGSFGNPGAYSGFLSVISPLVLSILLTYKRSEKVENLYYFLIVCLLFIVFLLIVSQSRGAWIACSLGCLLVLSSHYAWVEKLKRVLHTPTRKIVVVICSLLFVCTTGYALYQLKADSAFGRLFVWKIIAGQNGDGIGAVEANYGKWQSTYFSSGKGTEIERYVADYVTCAYNEFLELKVEHGIFFMVIFISLLFFAFLQKRSTISSLFIGAKASLAAITVLMFVSYPLKIPAIYIYFIFCLAVIFQKQKTGRPLHAIGLKWCLPVIALLVAVAGSYNIYGYSLLYKGQISVLNNQLDKGLEAYQKAESILKNNGIFHFYYGSALYQKQEYEAAIKELELSIKKSSNPNGFILLGNCYKEIGESNKAKESYLTTIHMIPSKLYPQYLLVKLLIENQEQAEAEIWATRILKTKEKVPTTAAKEIKSEMKQFINNDLFNFKNDLPMMEK